MCFLRQLKRVPNQIRLLKSCSCCLMSKVSRLLKLKLLSFHDEARLLSDIESWCLIFAQHLIKLVWTRRGANTSLIKPWDLLMLKISDFVVIKMRLAVLETGFAQCFVLQLELEFWQLALLIREAVLIINFLDVLGLKVNSEGGVLSFKIKALHPWELGLLMIWSIEAALNVQILHTFLISLRRSAPPKSRQERILENFNVFNLVKCISIVLLRDLDEFFFGCVFTWCDEAFLMIFKISFVSAANLVVHHFPALAA